MSNNISSKLNLAALKHTVQKMKGVEGEVEVLIIPINANNLYRGEKGLYLDLTHIEVKNPREGSKDTHLIKQSLPKDVYSKMSDEEKKAQPIMGNSIVWGEGGGGNSNEPAVQESKAGDALPWK